MTTSGTYNFTTATVDQIITDAYERIGISSNKLDDTKLSSAARSLNFVLSSWPNNQYGLKLWTLQRRMLALNAGQNTYNLPAQTIDIQQATIRQSIRNLGGTAFSSAGGTAASAFDGNPATACTQTAPNGYISYNWGTVQYAISMVGIQSNVTTTYTLVFEYSNDNVVWTQVGAPVAQTFTQGVNLWFNILVPTLGSFFRVKETGGGTLNVQELYFNTSINDTVLTPLSYADWVRIPIKNQPGRPTSYFVDRQINPVIILWPTPTTLYNNLFFSCTTQIQDIGQLVNSPQVPSRYLESLCSALAHKLAIKESVVDLAKVQYLKALYDEEFKLASEEDRERVPLRIYGDYTQGWTTV